MKIAIIDTETTGVTLDANIHELCAIVHDTEKNHVQMCHIKMCPNKDALIDEKALEVGHVTLEMLSKYPSQEEGFASFLKFLDKQVDKYTKGDRMFFCAFNKEFDIGHVLMWPSHEKVVRAEFDKRINRENTYNNFFGSYFWNNSMDTSDLATAYLADKRHNMVNFKLKTVLDTIGFKYKEEKLHEAKYDTWQTYRLHCHLVNIKPKEIVADDIFDNFDKRNL